MSARSALAIVALAIACSKPAAPPAASVAAVEPRPQPATAVAAENPSDDRETINALRLRVAQLEGDLESAKKALAASDEIGLRYKAGLEQAVAELNLRQAARSGERAVAYTAGAAAASRRDPARVMTLSAPEVQLAGDTMLVTGKLWNSGGTDAEGSIDIELLRDGTVYDTQSQSLFIAARTDVAYSASFNVVGTEGSWSARVIPRY